MAMRRYFVYIMASYSRRTYIGMSNSLDRRVWEHKSDMREGHTRQYKKHRLVYIEEYQWVLDAIAREKQIKGWTRQKKEDLVESVNPDWNDLSTDWYGDMIS